MGLDMRSLAFADILTRRLLCSVGSTVACTIFEWILTKETCKFIAVGLTKNDLIANSKSERLTRRYTHSYILIYNRMDMQMRIKRTQICTQTHTNAHTHGAQTYTQTRRSRHMHTYEQANDDIIRCLLSTQIARMIDRILRFYKFAGTSPSWQW